MNLDKPPVFWQKTQTMRLSYFILTQICLTCTAGSAKEVYDVGSIHELSWSTSIQSLKKDGYQPNRNDPMVNLEQRSLKLRKENQFPKVNALSRKMKHRDVLMHETALFLKDSF